MTGRGARDAQRVRPWRPAVLIIEVAVRGLPAGPVRQRYEREFITELYDLERSRQLRHAMGLLVGAPALRHAVLASPVSGGLTAAVIPNARTPLRCRLGVRHEWQTMSTEDGNRWVECARCGKDRNSGPPSDISGAPFMGGAQGM